MSPVQMRETLSGLYPGRWTARVAAMSDKQVAATYLRLLNAGKL